MKQHFRKKFFHEEARTYLEMFCVSYLLFSADTCEIQELQQRLYLVPYHSFSKINENISTPVKFCPSRQTIKTYSCARV